MKHTEDAIEMNVGPVVFQVFPDTERPPDVFTAEEIAARLKQISELRAAVRRAKTTSGRNGRPWREWIHEDHND